MDRRIFIQSLLGVAGTAVAATAFTSKAQALPLLDELKAMDAAGSPGTLVSGSEADLPAEGAIEAQYYYRRRYYRPRAYYRPRPIYRRCRTFVNRWGRLVRRCF
ncbi:MAG: hypothetical protein JWL62_2277 [Hyphomicrobiales bacterium]|nr:hypothetical protein [Hyphomicrobiales bacterium]